MEREKGDNLESSTAETVELTIPQEIGAYKERVGHRLIDVLMPATPPEPKNARVIRLFNSEAGESDARPLLEPAPKSQQQKRDAVRAARNQSLFAAAGFLRPGRADEKAGG